MRERTYSEGDRVWLSRAFCKSIGAWEYDVVNRAGTVAAVGPEFSPGRRLVRVTWDGDEEPTGILAANLHPYGAPEAE